MEEKSSKKNKIILVGGHDQACNILNHLIDIDIADVSLVLARKDDTGEDKIFPSLIKIAKRNDIPVIQPMNINSKKILDLVKGLNADLVLSIQNNMLFSKNWVDLFNSRLGIVNVHYSPLPRYAGFWPEMWAIWNAEKDFGVTLHYINNDIDTGDIIEQKIFPINVDETRSSLYEKSAKECYDLLVKNLPIIVENKITGRKQELEERKFYKRSLPYDGYLDLDWDSELQTKFIRSISFPGFPGPKIKINDKTYTLIEEDLPFFKPYKITSH